MEECRTLEVTLVSANGLGIKKKGSIYAVSSITSTRGNVQKFKTPVDKTGTWNFPIKFTVSELDVETQNLVVKIKAVGMLVNKNLGQVCVPIKDLLEGVTAQGKPMQSVSYELKREGFDLNFTYNFGENLVVERGVHSRQESLHSFAVEATLEAVEFFFYVFLFFAGLQD